MPEIVCQTTLTQNSYYSSNLLKKNKRPIVINGGTKPLINL